MSLQSSIIIILYVIAPLYSTYFFFKNKFKSKFEWYIWAFSACAFLLYLYVTAYWVIVDYYLRYILSVLLLISIVVSFFKIKKLPIFAKFTKTTVVSLTIMVLFTGFFLLNSIKAITGYFYNDELVELTFPLKNGSYFVMHGGNNVVINYHQVHNGQKFALDIVKMNSLGMRAKGLYPTDLTNYEIYGQEVFSPCDGEITLVDNQQPNQAQTNEDFMHAAGNFVIMKCKGVKVLLAHMIQSSIVVEKGESILEGDTIGYVGTSGNSSEPHLHIDAKMGGTLDDLENSIYDGVGVPITFHGIFLERNDVFSN